MYEVVTIITPINFILNHPQALKEINNENDTTLTDLDLMILATLKRVKKGLRNKAIMRALKGRIYEPKFTRSLDRLISLNYIVRTEYGRSVFYTITLKGARALQSWADRLMSLLSA